MGCDERSGERRDSGGSGPVLCRLFLLAGNGSGRADHDVRSNAFRGWFKASAKGTPMKPSTLKCGLVLLALTLAAIWGVFHLAGCAEQPRTPIGRLVASPLRGKHAHIWCAYYACELAPLIKKAGAKDVRLVLYQHSTGHHWVLLYSAYGKRWLADNENTDPQPVTGATTEAQIRSFAWGPVEIESNTAPR